MNCAAHIWCWPTSDADDGLAAGEAVDLAHQMLRLDFVGGEFGLERMLAPSTRGSAATTPARAPASLRHVRAAGSSQRLVQLLQHALHVAHDGHVRRAILADLGRIDIDVNHLGVRREGRQAAGDAIVEAHAERDQTDRYSVIPMLAA